MAVKSLEEIFIAVAIRTFFSDVKVGQEMEVYWWLRDFKGLYNCPYTVWEPLIDLSYDELMKAIDALVWDCLGVVVSEHEKIQQEHKNLKEQMEEYEAGMEEYEV